MYPLVVACVCVYACCSLTYVHVFVFLVACVIIRIYYDLFYYNFCWLLKHAFNEPLGWFNLGRQRDTNALGGAQF